jgi:hypothetical protein
MSWEKPGETRETRRTREMRGVRRDFMAREKRGELGNEVNEGNF